MESGDSYAVTDRTYPRYILRQSINMALGDLGGEDLQNTRYHNGQTR